MTSLIVYQHFELLVQYLVQSKLHLYSEHSRETQQSVGMFTSTSMSILVLMLFSCFTHRPFSGQNDHVIVLLDDWLPLVTV